MSFQQQITGVGTSSAPSWSGTRFLGSYNQGMKEKAMSKRLLWMISAALVAGVLTSAGVTRPAAAATIVGIGGKCLNVKGGSTADGTEVIIYTCAGTPPNEQWKLVNGQIVGIGGKCLNVKGGSTADGTEVIIYTCTGTAANEQWSWTNKGQIVGIGGKCLNVKGGSTADGTEVIIYTCAGTPPNEQWTIE